LPTEAEWEYACRAGTTTPFHTGDTITTDQSNYDGQQSYGKGKKGVMRDETTTVASFPPNAWGLHDMHGNVWEWCADWYGEYPAGPVTDPTGPADGTTRVVRGGCWVTAPAICRSANRGDTEPVSWNFHFGMRVVRELD
jgi:formylglycine-generating enzyme required for sulfatase activity